MLGVVNTLIPVILQDENSLAEEDLFQGVIDAENESDSDQEIETSDSDIEKDVSIQWTKIAYYTLDMLNTLTLALNYFHGIAAVHTKSSISE